MIKVAYLDSSGQIKDTLEKCDHAWRPTYDLSQKYATPDQCQLVLLHAGESGEIGGYTITQWIDHCLRRTTALVIEFTGSNTNAVDVVLDSRHWRCSRHAVTLYLPSLLREHSASPGKWDPACLRQDPVAALTAALHDLQNLAVKVDAQTAAEVARLPDGAVASHLQDCADMWKSTFGEGAVPAVVAAVAEIARRNDAAGRNVVSYLESDPHGPNLVRIFSIDGPFACAVHDANAVLNDAKIDPRSASSANSWAGVRARKGLALALARVATAAKESLVAPLASARLRLERANGKGV